MLFASFLAAVRVSTTVARVVTGRPFLGLLRLRQETQLNRTDPPLHPSQTVLVLPCGLSGLSRRTPCLAQIWNTQQHYYTVRHTCKPVVKTTPSQTSPHSWDVSRFELCIIATDFAIRIASAMGTTQIPAHI